MKFTAREMIDAIEGSAGILSHAARILGCSRSTIRRYCDKFPTVADALQEARENLIDEAEASLRHSVQAGEAWAVCFTLKTLGKSRGYNEKPALAEADRPPMRITLDIGENTPVIRPVIAPGPSRAELDAEFDDELD